MKQGIIGFLLAIVLIVGMSATTLPSLLTVKPSTPTSVISDYFYMPSSAVKWILQNSKKGFIVKSISSQQDYTLVVMEKY